MSVSLISNVGSLNAQTKLNASGAKLNTTVERLSSGLRINKSGDDAAGLAIANKYRSDIAILQQGIRNGNDALSTLQIVDGGLNTISNLLDRAATLSSQAASDTFNGDRDTLQQEFALVLDEITRQSQNIGLYEGGGNNKVLTTVIGGGSDAYSKTNTNNGISIDLSGSDNRVDADSLGLQKLNISSFGTIGASGGADFRNNSTTLSAETLSFRKLKADGTFDTAITIAFTATDTVSTALAKLNNDPALKNTGITASVNSQTGALEFKSGGLFTVSSSAAAGATNTGISSVVNGIRVSNAANSVTFAAPTTTAVATDKQKLSINISQTGQTVDIELAATATTGTALATAINSNEVLRAAGIVAVRDTTTGAASEGIRIVSAESNFTYSITNTGTTNGNVIDAPTTGFKSATLATATASTGAREALDKLEGAIDTLGRVQGRVGAGQNRIQQAIDLATSQVTNFQAAESRIRDADVTAEASNLSRLSVLQQAGVAALAQANQSTQAVLSLLR
jgi:flagellin